MTHPRPLEGYDGIAVAGHIFVARTAGLTLDSFADHRPYGRRSSAPRQNVCRTIGF